MEECKQSQSRRTVLESSFYSGVYKTGLATGYGLDEGGVELRFQIGSRIFTSPYRPDRLWGPPNLLSNGYQENFTWG
jgi:hypothetical protein